MLFGKENLHQRFQMSILTDWWVLYLRRSFDTQNIRLKPHNHGFLNVKTACNIRNKRTEYNIHQLYIRCVTIKMWTWFLCIYLYYVRLSTGWGVHCRVRIRRNICGNTPKNSWCGKIEQVPKYHNKPGGEHPETWLVENEGASWRA